MESVAMGEGEQRKTNSSEGCVDYRKFVFCRLMRTDDGLVKRGITGSLLIIMVTTVAMETCSFVSIFMSKQLQSCLDCVRSFLLGNLVTMVLFNEFANRKRLARLHDFLNSSMSSPRTDLPEAQEILNKAREEASSSLRMYIIIFSGNIAPMILAQPLAEWISGHSWKKLPIPWAFPPSDSDVKFGLVFTFQCIGVCIANCLGMVFMSFSSITIQMTAMFDVLLLSLRRIENRATIRTQREEMDYKTSLLYCLREDVIFYQQLVREMTSATPHLRNTFLAFSATVPMIMACEAYPIISGNFTIGDLIRSFVFLAIQFTCWAQTCTKLETMTDQHEAVFREIYQTPWSDSGPVYKRLVYTTLLFSTQPKHIKARLSNEISATTSTFYSFVVSSFNWLSIIRKMN
ncbi:hypothetical protein GE061_012688 [Apolygus lucorum]|uniref:Odorant receptor n=1 Tax=Apolygus lucorum TaxID=248454 RepID=A0A6A4JQD0_APOLU|nr:hypothetical protein GE061_012688 [Apolygus lucorum]